ncbi:MAG: 16S rRNA (cytosine(1402)-N(4))-methyltransferase RsmH [Gemmobacter sp.]
MDAAPHIPVLIGPILRLCAPIAGEWLDGTFGAGGYARALLDAGASRVTAIDRDASAVARGRAMQADYGDRLQLVEGTFSDLDRHAPGPLDGVVLDLGVSSMQLDEADRGFSFLRDGPLDMRMGGQGTSAADIVNSADEARLADILYHYGEERAARRIARAIVAARPIAGTARLAEVVAACLPRPKPGQSHPATRSFQAIRIAVNDEFGELVRGLGAAERALRPGGLLAVVSFHSLEDRIVKRFFAQAAGGQPGSRHAPETAREAARFEPVTRRAVGPDAPEIAANPRARSALLRIGRRTAAAARAPDPAMLAAPALPAQRKGR